MVRQTNRAVAANITLLSAPRSLFVLIEQHLLQKEIGFRRVSRAGKAVLPESICVWFNEPMIQSIDDSIEELAH